jgi:hypothetical protein
MLKSFGGLRYPSAIDEVRRDCAQTVDDVRAAEVQNNSCINDRSIHFSCRLCCPERCGLCPLYVARAIAVGERLDDLQHPPGHANVRTTAVIYLDYLDATEMNEAAITAVEAAYNAMIS